MRMRSNIYIRNYHRQKQYGYMHSSLITLHYLLRFSLYNVYVMNIHVRAGIELQLSQTGAISSLTGPQFWQVSEMC